MTSLTRPGASYVPAPWPAGRFRPRRMSTTSGRQTANSRPSSAKSKSNAITAGCRYMRAWSMPSARWWAVGGSFPWARNAFWNVAHEHLTGIATALILPLKVPRWSQSQWTRVVWNQVICYRWPALCSRWLISRTRFAAASIKERGVIFQSRRPQNGSVIRRSASSSWKGHR